MLDVNNLIGFGVAGNLAPPAFSFQGSAVSGSGPALPVTFAAQPIGAADDDERAVFVGIAGLGGGIDITGVTIGGVSAQKCAESAINPGTVVEEFWAARVPKSVGTTADVTISVDPSGFSHFFVCRHRHLERHRH